MDSEMIVSKLDSAKRAIDKAEEDLEKALSEIRVAPRAEKTAITRVLEDAFTTLKRARRDLAEIETLVKKGD